MANYVIDNIDGASAYESGSGSGYGYDSADGCSSGSSDFYKYSNG